jgi:hypothetical protein
MDYREGKYGEAHGLSEAKDRTRGLMAFGHEAFDELSLWMRVLSANCRGSGN